MTVSTFADSMVKSHYLIRSGHTMPEWASLSIKEAAERSGYNEEYLRRLIRFKKIEAVKVGPAYLIRADDLERYMAEVQADDDARTGPRRPKRK